MQSPRSDRISDDGLASVHFPAASAVERWLESLCMAGDSERQIRGRGDAPLLFVLDNDFGELTTVMYLVMGQECLRNARILLSDRLHQNNHDVLPGRTGVWRSEQDLAGEIEALRPALVVFASGYLLPVHNLLTAEAMQRLCVLARRHHSVVMTADPFLGLLSPWSGRMERLISIDIPKDADERLRAVKRSADAMLHTRLSDAERVLRDVPHLYPSYTDMRAVDRFGTDGRNRSFFNDALLLPGDVKSAVTSEGEAPHWMFVISEADYATQVMFRSAAEFARIVAVLLEQTARLGRHAIFAGPAELLNLVSSTLAPAERIHLLRYCSFRRFMSLLLSAEYTFYWNVVSHSILMQLWNGRPVILFDRGHLARAVRPIYDRVIAWYYQSWEPPYLDDRAVLSLSAVEDALSAHADRRQEIAARFRRAPSPDALLASLLDGAPPASGDFDVQSLER
jgi:hypothetical protein